MRHIAHIHFLLHGVKREGLSDIGSDREKHGDLFPGGKAFSIGVKEGRARMQIAVINCLLYVEYEGKVSRDQGTIRLIL